MNDDITLEEKVEIFEQYDTDLENKIESIIKIDNHSVSSLNDSFFQDLEIFEDHLQDESKSILCKIDKTNTLFGKVFLKDRLRHPTFDIKYLNRQKQNIIKINTNT